MINWWNDTITLYTPVTDTDKRISYTRTVVSGAFFALVARRTRDDARSDSVYIARLPLERCAVAPQCGGIIVRGEVEDNIDEYTAGARASDLLAKYATRGAFRIGVCVANDKIPPRHYRCEEGEK